ncbi:nucleotidyltransferase family protein [Omnitrophica bacterium]|nr:nucleotidyltransferase family protein [Candidatus Omnitrophota bacterium]
MITKLALPQVKKRAGRIAKETYLSLLRENECVYLSTCGFSMRPFIKEGDIIKVVRANEDDIRIGDIVAVDNDGQAESWFYAHRVIKILDCGGGRRLYVTKGDAHKDVFDKGIEFNRIAGRITEIRRDGFTIDLESRIWRYLNTCIGHISLKYPDRLCAIAPYISIIVEWRRFPSKVMKRMRKVDFITRNTEELLLICVRGDLDEDLVRRARLLLKKGVDWDLFIDSAVRSGLSSLFYDALNEINYPSVIPKGTFNRLKEVYLYAIPRTISQHKETTDLLKRFSEEGIPVVPLKGTLLSRELYGDIVTRGMNSDIDLLVEEGNRTRAKKILEEAGYIYAPNSSKCPDEEFIGQSLFSKPGASRVEIHWKINPVPLKSNVMKEFWRGTKPREEGAVRYYEFGKEELLLQLSVHLVHSARLAKIRYICDIDRLLAKYRDTLDWAEVVQKAKRWRLSGCVYVTLFFSRRLLQSYIPKGVLAKLRPNLPTRFLVRVLASPDVFFRSGSKGRRFIEVFLRHMIFQLFEARSLKDYMSIIFAPKEIIGDKTYFRRFTGGIKKFIKWLR